MSALDLSELDQLQANYVHALDTKNMQQWLSLFCSDPDASYICTTRENVKKELPLALMLDDCHARIEDRVTFVTKIWAGTFQDYQTRHLTQRLLAKRLEDGTIRINSGFAVYYTADESGSSAILATGEYEDLVKFENGEPRFLSKKVILDTSVLPRYLVYPL